MPAAYPIIGAETSVTFLVFRHPGASREPGFVQSDLPAMLHSVQEPAKGRTDEPQ